MEKLEVGEYVRTKDGKIVKIIGMDEILISYETEENPGYNDLYGEDILKHSKDIIDLIQVGDIIEVHFPVRNKIRKIYVDEYFENSMVLNGITSKNLILKTILTKEMFEANCYKVKEK